ncbi:NAD-dependent epimerase/dehydratase family protein [Amycolatopsis sp. cmx-4-68]|uniref:NAD-dependent epimerase/dehydratase family protein n=1 Tax=Amycolatopsis sp. cmx-4-68 TaxID=2790938 RepID=UPI00397A25DE
MLGATGYLGQHICTAFAAAGAGVLAVSRSAQRAGAPSWNGDTGVRAVSLDLAEADSATLTRLCATSEAQVVVNAAGTVWHGTADKMITVNARMVERLTSAVAELPQRPRLIQIGTAYEYGPAGPDDLIDEDWPPAPVTAYGRTKLAGTRAVLHAVRAGRVDGVVLRASVTCGPGAPQGSLPGNVAADLAAGCDVLRLAPLLAHRDILDVRDVADAVVAAARVPATAFTRVDPIINIARGESVSVREFVELMITCSGRSVRILEEEPDANRSGTLWQRLDVSRARQLLNWTSRRTLTESVHDLLAAAGIPGTDVPIDSALGSF